MLSTLVLYMPPPGSPVAGTLSILIAITIAFWGPILLLVRRVRHRPILIEEDWRNLFLKRQEESGGAITLDHVLLERARGHPDVIRAMKARDRGGQVWFRDRKGRVARLPLDDLRKAA
ncbi:hypothetical protein HZC00_02140 [Candidatus Kaiserbacteria bacterium]|nr:hypothetical protein [Candidatus Kaiserbacteria bacterium]